MAVNDPVVVHTTADGINVYVRPGTKKEWDFIVSHGRPNGETHQVFHRDLILDIYRKRQVALDASRALVNHLIEIIDRAEKVNSFPPALAYFSQDHVKTLLCAGLPNTEGYDLELFLVVFEMVQIQEETNYPRGWLPKKLYGTLRDDPQDLEEIAYLTEVVVPYRESPKTLRQRDELLAELRGVVGG